MFHLLLTCCTDGSCQLLPHPLWPSQASYRAMLKVFCMFFGILFVNPLSIPCLNLCYGHGSELGLLKYSKYVPVYFFCGKEKPQTTKASAFLFWEASSSFPQIKFSLIFVLFCCNTVSRTRQHVCRETHFSANYELGGFSGAYQGWMGLSKCLDGDCEIGRDMENMCWSPLSKLT